MNKLPWITVLLWAFFFIASWFLPEIFRKDLVQLLATVLLSTLLPISLWQLARTEKRVFAMFVAGIFFFDIGLLSFALQNSYTAQQMVARELTNTMQPRFAEYVESGASTSKRKLAAQLFYRLHGIALPYKNDAASYTLYVPEQADKDTYRDNSRSANTLKLQGMDLAASLKTIAFLLLIHVVLFTGLLVFLLLYDKKKIDGGKNTSE